MADLADVLDVLEAMARSVVLPNGDGQIGITGRAVDVGQGWPLPADLDAAMRVQGSIVSIYAVPGTSSDPGQVFDWQPAAISAPAPGMAAAVTGNMVTFSGAPNPNDLIAVTASGAVYTYTAQSGDLAESVAANLAALIPGAQWSGTVLVLPGARGVSCALGAPGLLGERIYRQRQQFLIVVWAPSPADRTAIAAPLDVALKRSVTITMPDTSEATIVHQGTRITDKGANESMYRRDLVFFVTWDTIDSYQGTPILAPQMSFSGNAPTS